MAYGRTGYGAVINQVNQNRYSTPTDTRRLGDRTLFTNTVRGKRYYSSLDAEIHFGETYIDEITQITWSIEQATMPLFGYNSYTFDDIAVGARQVSGNFVLNFTKSGFLYDVLKNVQAINRSTYYTPDNLSTNKNLEWTSNYEKEHKASWNKNFNIRVGYGDYASNPDKNTMIVLHCVQITGCQQMIGVDGSPIAEIYSFIAKDVRYETNLLAMTVEDSKPYVPENTNVKPPEFIFTASDYQLNELEIDKKKLYRFSFYYRYSGGDIDSVNIQLRDNSNAIINATGVNAKLYENGIAVCTIPDEYTSRLNNIFASQKALGNNLFVFVTIEVTYNINNVTNTKYIRNQRVQLS